MSNKASVRIETSGGTVFTAELTDAQARDLAKQIPAPVHRTLGSDSTIGKRPRMLGATVVRPQG